MSALVQFRARIASEPELTRTAHGRSVCRFRIATKSRYRDSDGVWRDPKNPVFLDLRSFGEVAEAIYSLVTKGDRIAGTASIEQYVSDIKGARRRTTYLVTNEIVHVITQASSSHADNTNDANIDEEDTTSESEPDPIPGTASSPDEEAVAEDEATEVQPTPGEDLWEQMGTPPV